MEGGTAASSAPPSGGNAQNADAVAGTDEGALTDTGDIPIPVAPYAVTGYPRQRRRLCFDDAIRKCR